MTSLFQKLMVALMGLVTLLGVHHITQKTNVSGTGLPTIMYQIWYINREDDVHISQAAVRFYIVTPTLTTETNPVGTIRQVTEYPIVQEVQSFPTAFNGFIKDSKGVTVKLYTQKDFGNISTDSDLELFLNSQLVNMSTFLSLPTVSIQTGTQITP